MQFYICESFHMRKIRLEFYEFCILTSSCGRHPSYKIWLIALREGCLEKKMQGIMNNSEKKGTVVRETK